MLVFNLSCTDYLIIELYPRDTGYSVQYVCETDSPAACPDPSDAVGKKLTGLTDICQISIIHVCFMCV